jgi:hypothetical protein
VFLGGETRSGEERAGLLGFFDRGVARARYLSPREFRSAEHGTPEGLRYSCPAAVP